MPKNLSIVDRLRRKLRTKKGRERYGLRQELPEPVFSQIKQVRGFRQFPLGGKDKARREWSFISTGHNVLKLFRAHADGLVGPGALEPAIICIDRKPRLYKDKGPAKPLRQDWTLFWEDPGHMD